MKFEHTKIFNIENALRGMRNPKDSWDKSDTIIDNRNYPLIGENDLKLAQSLIKAGGEHRKFIRQIFISVDISAPRYWWAEFDTYKIGTVANSCSTMHKLASYPITKDMFEIESNNVFIDEYIEHLENLRKLYLKTKDYDYFRDLKQLLPESFIQKRTITMNYENVLNMIHQRENHRLKEWSTDFINWAKTLDYANELLFLKA